MRASRSLSPLAMNIAYWHTRTRAYAHYVSCSMYIHTDWKVSMHSVHRGRLHSTRDAPDVTTHMAITPIFPYREETPRARGKQTTDAIRLDTTQFIRHPVCTCTTCVCVYMHVCVCLSCRVCVSQSAACRGIFSYHYRAKIIPKLCVCSIYFFHARPRETKLLCVDSRIFISDLYFVILQLRLVITTDDCNSHVYTGSAKISSTMSCVLSLIKTRITAINIRRWRIRFDKEIKQ